MDKNKNFYDWDKVKQLADYLKYNSNDVYNIIKNYYYHKHPTYLTFIVLGLIKKNLIKIKLDKEIRNIEGQIIKRRKNEEDIHYAIRADEKFFREFYKPKPIFREKVDFFKSLTRQYKDKYKKYSREINSHSKTDH